MVFEKLKEIFGRVMPQCDPATIKMDSVLATDLGVDSLNMMLLAITVDCLCYGKRRLGYECSSCSYNIFYVHRRWNTGWNAVVKKSF